MRSVEHNISILRRMTAKIATVTSKKGKGPVTLDIMSHVIFDIAIYC